MTGNPIEQARQRANDAQELAKKAFETLADLAGKPDMDDDEAVPAVIGVIIDYAGAVVGMLGANVAANLAIAAAIAPAAPGTSEVAGGMPEAPEAGNDAQRDAQRAVAALLDGWREDQHFMFVKRRDEESWDELREQVLDRILGIAR